jgi:hypothetical protein
MKAKELAEILMKNPEAEVVHYEYIGGPNPLCIINKVTLELKGTKCTSYDGGDFVGQNNIVLKDIIILMNDSNC